LDSWRIIESQPLVLARSHWCVPPIGVPKHHSAITTKWKTAFSPSEFLDHRERGNLVERRVTTGALVLPLPFAGCANPCPADPPRIGNPPPSFAPLRTSARAWWTGASISAAAHAAIIAKRIFMVWRLPCNRPFWIAAGLRGGRSVAWSR
jgi:hypothetical protein